MTGTCTRHPVARRQATARRLLPFALLVAIVLAGCGEDRLSPRGVLSPEAEARTRAAAETLLTRDLDRIRRSLTTSAETAEVDGMMPAVREMLDDQVPEPIVGELHLVHAEHRRSDASPDAFPMHQASYEVRHAGGLLLVEVVVEDGGPQATGLSWFRIRPLAAPIAGANDFGDVPLTAGRVAFVTAMCLNLVFVVGTAVVVARDRTQKRRWLWVPFVLCGLWDVTMNWTTGALSMDVLTFEETRFEFTPIQFVLFGAAFSRAAYAAPWLLQIGLPVGALVYWWRRRARRRRPAEPA